MVLLRGLPTLGTVHSVAIVELDPEAANFGALLQDFELPDLQAPLHHLYYSPTGRLYSTGLDPKCSLAEVGLSRNAEGAAVIKGVTCLEHPGPAGWRRHHLAQRQRQGVHVRHLHGWHRSWISPTVARSACSTRRATR